jgi:hypothetical protein
MLAKGQKEIILTLVKSRLRSVSDSSFDDFVIEKGQGIIALLQYDLLHARLIVCLLIDLSGPFEVSKTQTAESISERYRRSLYAICISSLFSSSSEPEN